MKYSSPQRITIDHIVKDFDCGESSLNDWLKKRALKNEQSDASRTYVVCGESAVVAYYALHLGEIRHLDAVRKIKRNMPDPIPAIVLGRLAVDINHQGKGLAKGLMKDMFLTQMSKRIPHTSTLWV